MVQQRGQFTKSMGKFARMQNRHLDDSDEGSDDGGEEGSEEEEEPPNRVSRIEPDASDDDDEGDMEEGSDEDEEPAHSKRKKSAFIDDAADDDEDEEDEEEEDTRRGGKKARDHKRARFNLVDDEADVDEEDEEEEDDEDANDLINDEEEEAKAVAQDARQMHARMTNLQAQTAAFQSEEDLERFIAERYGERNAMDEDLAEGTEVEQQAMLPTVKDPKLWIVRARPGSEREACVQLMQKYIDAAAKGQPLHIKSCLVQDHVKGYIYVEADKQSHVDDAVRGLRNIFGFRGAKLVPIGEMTEVMTIQSSGKSMLKASTKEKNYYVRIRNGLYKDDLAQVVDLSYAENQATVKLLPRLDLQAMKEKHDGVTAPTHKRPRPQPRIFATQDAKDVGLAGSLTLHKLDRASGQYYDYLDTLRFQNGYLIKSVAITSCRMEETPSFDELQKFHSASADEDADDHGGTSASAELKKLTKQVAQGSDVVRFMPGDTVKVIEGDLNNLLGTVDRVEADGQVLIMPKIKDFNTKLRFKPEQLQKHFLEGDHVKVTSGQHDGDTGMVVAVEGNVATLFTDIGREEIKVFTRDLVECQEVATGLTTFGQFELHDLVALDPTTVGIIVKVEREACLVLTNSGTPELPNIRTCRLPDLKRKLQTKMSSAQDMNMNPVRQDDMVNVTEGRLKGKQLTIHHVHRGFLFGRCRDLPEYGGMVCLRARTCTVHGGKVNPNAANRPQAGGMNYPMSPGHGLRDPMQQAGGRSPMLSPRGGPSGPQGGRGSFSGNARGARRDDSLVGTILKVKTGPWRGYKGKVTDATDTTVRMELEATMKTVTVPKTQLAITAPAAFGQGAPGAARSPYESAGAWTPGGARTPSRADMMKTPMRGDQTPMHGDMRTPMRESAWNPGNATPMHAPAWHEDPGTPGTHQAGTPGGGHAGSYAAATAGTPGAYTPYDTYSEQHAGGTPGANADTPTYTTGTTNTGTPSASDMPGSTAYTPSDVPYSPSVASPGHSGVSSLGAAGGNRDEVWAVPGLVVSLKAGGDTGVVRSVAPDGRCKVELGPLKEGRLESVEKETSTLYTDLTLVPPVKWDNIRVVHGTDRGLEAQLIGVDGTDGVLKVKDKKGTIKILDMCNLGKMAADESTRED